MQLTCIERVDDDLEDVPGHVDSDLLLFLVAKEPLEELALSRQNQLVRYQRGNQPF